ncbi:hypothetical protein AK830_g2744 [Neonectria ditissima]|uniref:Tautomerase cis-CaaD-like domain-containing protein n=1 Tax=Neonectria ditissima TaxID=78410 RepID=A0A0P7BRE7_9HYPO|nr:hypothetical protein AK830_g2744 [Neonectria ditissima]
MPFYDVSHSYPLDGAQRQQIAERVTALHCTMFNAPALFVNIRFSPIKDEEYWYGGKQKKNTNRIFAHVRSGSNRSDEAFAQLAKELEAIWDEVVGRKSSDIGPNNAKVLQAVFVIPGITAREEGLAIPPAGTESAWLKENLTSFQERAERGDEDFQDLLAELKDRPELLG